MKSPLKPHSGFTLLELLAVVAIVLVLLALLFPMTQNLLEKGSRATCSGNLRAIGAAFDLLLVENGGAYPSYSNNPDPADTGVWFNKLRPYLGVDDTKGIGVTQP
ncbi:MAG: type II secretion system protein, partial [Chthoniobacterales bacterium]